MIRIFQRSVSTLKSCVTFQLQHGDIEIKYTKCDDKIFKQILSRHIDDEETELIHPQTSSDYKSLRY